ncbi:MAG: hypothetical protein IT319_13260, partial [Anaerolineae bacterium]|nr:hypothetical protein [Anaerolineae bacterium]
MKKLLLLFCLLLTVHVAAAQDATAEATIEPTAEAASEATPPPDALLR